MAEKDSVLLAPSVMERLSLSGRVCLLTGAASGIGRAIAHALADAGGSVALVDKDPAAADVVAQEIAERNPGAPTLVIEADVTEAQDMERAVSRTVEEFGELSVGINNAGIAQWSDAMEMSEEDLRRMFDVNVYGVFYGAVAQARQMAAKGYGKIINTASISGYIANRPQSQSHYNAAKSAVLGFTRSLAVEWVDRGIRVNSISPGYTRTALVDHFLGTPPGAEALPSWLDRTPMRKLADPTDLQGAVVFLASAASDFITGSDIVIDGGYLAA
mgnify:CR=1 FL=1